MQGKTRLELTGGENAATDNFHCHIHGAFDPETVRPFLTASNVTRAFEIVKLTGPLALDADVNGRPDDYDRHRGGRARGGDEFHGARRDIWRRDGGVQLHKPGAGVFQSADAHRRADVGGGQNLTLDFNTRMIYFTNGFSTADPQSVVRAIGPKTAELMEPYHFLEPPTVRVNGQLPLRDMNEGRDMADVDMRFDVIKGAPFEWMKFRTTNIVGTIHWQAQTLILTNVASAFYGGEGNGFANFDFRPAHEGADYQFMADVTNVDLHALTTGLSSLTNHLEGTLAGKLVVTHADTRDWRTWNGYGHAKLRDGLIWDEPIFGILSPVLNAVSPGLGSSRATDASAEFIITNGVIFTDSLEIRATMAQLQYAGTVDMAGNVNMRVNALLLRNTPVIGWWVSLVSTPFTKLFEYHVTGTLENPRSDPVYVPKFLLMPLHPIRSIQDFFPGGAMTNAPTGN